MLNNDPFVFGMLVISGQADFFGLIKALDTQRKREKGSSHESTIIFKGTECNL